MSDLPTTTNNQQIITIGDSAIDALAVPNQKQRPVLLAVRAFHRNGGKSRIWTDPQQIIDLACEYFTAAHESEEPITITGCCSWMGTTRETMLTYLNGSHTGPNGDDAWIADTLKHVRHVVESYAEQHGFTARNPAMAIFALKNYGWKDTQTIENTTTEVHTVDPETRQLIREYMRQLAGAQKGVIDVTPREEVKVLGVSLGVSQDNAQDKDKDKA